MEIFVFLIGLGCLVLLVWAITLLNKLIADRKYWRQNRPQKRSPSPPPESKQQPLYKFPPIAVQTRKVVALKQPPVSTRVQLPSNKHQQYIRLTNSVLKRLRDRSTVVQLPEALGILRKMNPYAFEELLLTCCHDSGWEIERNFRYSNDDGIDGRVLIAGKLYLVQAKRYRNYIKPQHIRDFHRVIKGDKAVGGFFIHKLIDT